MSRCVVSVGVGAGKWYPRGVARLATSLDKVGDKSTRALWTDALPPGSATHEALPYGFKVAALVEARRRGADSVLWCDASCWAIRSLEPAWRRLDEVGHLLVDCENFLSQWSTDRSLAWLGFERERDLFVRLVTGGMFGIRFSSPVGSILFDRMVELAVPDVLCGDWKNDRTQCSTDPRVRGHRHDQVLMGFLAHDMKLPLIKQPEFFAYDSPNPDPTTLVVARGM